MKVHLKYGKKGLTVDFPKDNVTVIEPDFVAGLSDEKQAFCEALHNPIGTVPLRELVKTGDTIAIVFCDITRPVPNNRIIPWLLEELSFQVKQGSLHAAMCRR